MKTVLCYGDSLTWGYDPKSRSRHVLEPLAVGSGRIAG
jgi:lysophospholipase L1-like esterase